VDGIICVAGKNRIACEALQFLRAEDLPVVVLPNIRNSQLPANQPDLLVLAERSGVRTIDVAEAKKIENLVFLSLECDRLLRPAEFRSPRLFNVHFSLLPKYKGCHTSLWPILFGEEVTGVTLHEIDQGIDTGPIIDQLEIKIFPDLTAVRLYEIYQDTALRLLKKNLTALLKGTYFSVAQTTKDSSYFSRGSLSDLDLEIDFEQTARQISNFVNALFFPEFQTAMYRGRSVRRVIVTNRRSEQVPGTSWLSGEGFFVATEDFDIEITFLEETRAWPS
jgi:methionyl-tRNA formyltransferase